MSDPSPEHLFYDGTCGVCHWAVRFVAERDDESAFRFAPLGGETFEEKIPAAERDVLPDSIVVATSDDRRLVRSGAVIHILWRLGGIWKIPAALLVIVPRILRDAGYAAFARIRKRLVAEPDGTCPLVPPELARRFDP